MAELLQTLSYTSFILAVVFVALAVVLFLAFDIRSVIGEITGKTATTAIAKIREQGTTRQYKGRTLQSIVLEKEGDSTDFSLDKLDLQHGHQPATGKDVSEAATTLLGVDTSGESEVSEAATTLLGADELEMSEAATTFLSADTSGEPEVSEAATTLLSTNGAPFSEQETTLLYGEDHVSQS